MPSTAATWETFGQVVMALMFTALLAYLAPGTMSLRPQTQRWLQFAASALLGVALLIAIVATVAWFAL